MRPRIIRRDDRRLLVRGSRFVPPPLKLPCVADSHSRGRVVRPQRGRMLKRLARALVPLGPHLSAGEFHPDVGVAAVVDERLAVVSRGKLKRSLVHRSSCPRQRPSCTPREKRQEWNKKQNGLTRMRIAPTMRSMTRDHLLEILKRTPGVKETKKGFDVTEGHELSFYIGGHGQSTLIGEVKHLIAETAHVEATVTDRRTFFIPYESITMCSARAPRDTAERRTGFA